MNGMLSRASGNSQPLLNLQIAKQQHKRHHHLLHSAYKGAGLWQQHHPGGDQQGEPTSVLDIRSPSPTSTLSSSLGAASSVESGAVAAVSGLYCEAVSDHNHHNTVGTNTKGEGGLCANVKREEPSRPEEWNAQQVGAGGGGGGGMEDLESMLLESAAAAPDQSLMRWLLGEAPATEDQHGATTFEQTHPPASFSFPTNVTTEAAAYSAQITAPGTSSMAFVRPQQIRQHEMAYPSYQENVVFPSPQQLVPSHPRLLSVPPQPTPPMQGFMPMPQSQQTAVDQLIRAAEAVEEGSIGQAQEILARLNHQLPSPEGKPLQRAAYYFKESLTSLLRNDFRSRCTTPMDVVHKIGAYKSFAETSPLAQFANLTTTQALLEVLEGAPAVHVVDMDLGLGGHWAPLLQELALRSSGPPAVRLTALGPPSAETCLAGENLRYFAKQLNISFEFTTSLDTPQGAARPGETVAVIMTPASVRRLGTPEVFIRLLRELSPRAALVLDAEPPPAGSFTAAFYEALQFYAFVFDSLENVNMQEGAVHKAEKYLLAGRIDAAVVNAARAEQRPPWRAVMTMFGMCPVAPSNFTETQAEYLTRRAQTRGFQVSKVHTTLHLAWQGRPLVSATAWRFAAQNPIVS